MFLARSFDVSVADSVMEWPSRTRTNSPGHSTETPTQNDTLPILHTVSRLKCPLPTPRKVSHGPCSQPNAMRVEGCVSL